MALMLSFMVVHHQVNGNIFLWFLGSDPVSMKTIGNLLDTVKNTPEEKFFTPNYGNH